MFEGKRGRILLSIALIFAVPILVLALSARDILLSFMTIAFIILMYYTNEIDPEPYRIEDLEKLKGDIFIWCMLPLLFGAFGAARILDLHFYFVFRDIAFTALASVFAFLIMLNMDYHTDFRPNRLFTVSFIIISTIGMGTVFAISRFITDRYMNTGYLAGNTHIMIYLIIITLSGFTIGINLMDYIDSYEFFPLKNVGSHLKIKDDFEGHAEEFLKLLNKLFGDYDHPSIISISHAFQAGIFVTVLYGFFLGRWIIFSWSLFSFIFAISPDIFKRKTGYTPPSIIYFWVTSVTFVYAFGRPAGFYRLFGWWAGITHFLAGTLVAVLVFSFLVYLDWVSENLYFPSYIIPILVLLSIFPIGVLWEISEFFVDVFFDRRLQAGLEDTVIDLLCNFAGTAVSLIIIYGLIEESTVEEIESRVNIFQNIKGRIKGFKNRL